MLEHVTANQTRFVAPGLAPDSRRVALGRYCVVLLPTLDRVVGFFRGLSEHTSLDDLLPSLQIIQVRTPLKSQEFLVRIPVHNSFSADGLAQIAMLLGGLTFTGTSKHFIKYRDHRSPLGYDVDNIHSDPGDFILYTEEFVQTYQKVKELAFHRLVLNLSLEAVRGDGLRPGEQVLLGVVPGLWRMIVGYLHRNNVPCKAAACESGSRQAEDPRRIYLIQTRMEARMEALFRQTPGVTLYRMKTERAAVQLGYRHPVELSSCNSIFEEDKFYLFDGDGDRLEVITGTPTFIDSGALVALDTTLELLETREAPARKIEGKIQLPLKLVTSQGPRPATRAARIPLHQAPWLKKLVYLLPPQALETTQICITEESVYLLGDRGMEFIPLGQMFYEEAPGVMVALGYELLPRVHPEVLIEHLQKSWEQPLSEQFQQHLQAPAGGPGSDRIIFFCPDAPTALGLSRGAFAPLSRKALAHVRVDTPAARSAPSRARENSASLINDPVGAFPLWGFSPQPEE